jgi:hypothetical protein
VQLSALIRVETNLSYIDFLAVENFEMNEQKLVYTGIEIVLLTEFPELTDRMKNTFGAYYDLTSEMPQAYPVFESVFQEFLMEKLLQHDGDKVLDRIFLFCERMARSEDAEVVNLLWRSLAWNLDTNERRPRP